jgi:ABC-type bacteriocin/lantibiotic exporter with double-glycine peptidase domain
MFVSSLISVGKIQKLSKLENESNTKDSIDLINNNINENDKITNGNIKFNNVKMKYNKNQNLILKNINFEIKENECIGIIGRFILINYF